MNKLIYISAIILGLAFVSCTKEEIVPVNSSSQEAPIWGTEKSLLDFGENVDDLEGSIEPSSDDHSRDRDIADPNNDPDGKSQN